jgi:hypothetical protein
MRYLIVIHTAPRTLKWLMATVAQDGARLLRDWLKGNHPNHGEVAMKAYIEVGDTRRILALLFGAFLCTPSLAVGPVYCNQSFVAEAQSRCVSESAEPCMLISWAMYGQPARCQLVGNTLVWWVGVPATGTVMDPSSGELTVTYTWVPLTKPAPAYMLAPLSVPSAPTDVRVY